MADAPYDPYIPPGGSAQTGPHDKTKALQKQIDDTVEVMRENVNKVAERGERIENLRGKTDELAESSLQFRRGANQVRKKMWWKDMKMRMWIIIGIIVLLVIIIVPAVVTTHH